MTSDENNRWLYRRLSSKYYDNDLDLLALDHYKPDSQGEDEFSRRQVWFYVYGDEEIYEDFVDNIEDLLDSVVSQSDISWDLLTLIPTEIEEQINPNMEKIAETVSKTQSIEYRPLLERENTVQEEDIMRTFRHRLVNIEDSINLTEDIEGKNIILMDNVAITGASMLHAANLLLENGAKNVLGLCLGASSEHGSDDVVGIEGMSLEQIRSKHADNLSKED